MKHALLITAIFTLMQSSQLMADEQKSHRPSSGLITGISMVAGALMGGPGYLITSTALGAIYDTQADDKYRLAQELDQQQKELASLRISNKKEIASMGNEIAEREAQFQLASTRWSNSISSLERNFAYTLQFRTGSSDIESHYIRDLTNLAQLLKKTPGLQLKLAGFSDRMGDETFNQQLSSARASQVKRFFEKQGIDKTRIETHAYGESRPLNIQSSIEDNAFERRVMISINPPYKAVVSN